MMISLFAECEISAYEETVDGTNYRSDYFRWCSPYLARLDKELHTSVVQKYRAYDCKGVLCQLR